MYRIGYLTSFPRSSRSMLVGVLLFFSSACDTGYWWSRGQAPSVDTLLAKSSAQLDEAKAKFGQARAALRDPATGVQNSLEGAVAALSVGNRDQALKELESARNGFMLLEGKLSVGSRATYGELSGQLRGIFSAAAAGAPVDRSTVGLLAARTMFFLANEFSVPAPTWG